MGAYNTSSYNTKRYAGDGVSSVVIVATGSGQLVEFEQTVGLIGSGQLVAFEQNVELYEVGSGLIVSFEQNTLAKASGQIIALEQNVTTLSANTFYTRNGYDVVISIGGYLIEKSKITGNIDIESRVGENATCTFTILADSGIQDPEAFQGQPVYINIIKNSISYRRFTGFVDVPLIDLIDEKITFKCSSNRKNKLNALSRSIIETVGSYSTDVFGTATDNSEEIDRRLQTVTADFDIDRFGNFELASWTPKTTADFTLAGSDVYYDKPEVEYSERRQTLNTVNFTINYTFQRLHQQNVNFVWSGYDSLNYWYSLGQPSFPTKDMIENAARGSNWKLTRAITHVDLWDAQAFTAGGSTVIWQPDKVTNEYKLRTKYVWVKDANNNLTQVEVPVLDVSGNKIYDKSKTIITDASSYLSRGANWTAALKFAQNVKETYNITIRSPQAISRYGIINQDDSIDIVDEFDVSQWEDPASGVYSTDYNFFVDSKENYDKLFNSMQVMLNKSRCDILRAHRDVLVKFRTPIWPDLDLKHTVETTATRISSKGKVDYIRHSINCSTGEASTYVELRLSRARTVDSADTWAIIIPPVETYTYIGDPQTIGLETHVGEDPDTTVTPGADKWNGFIGNANKTETSATNLIKYRTDYVESFRVDYPAIPDIIRQTLNLPSDYTFDVTVPNDSLTVTF